MGWFFNKKPRDEMQPEQFPAPIQLPESQVEFQNLIVTPDARATFNNVNRDVVLGNLNPAELNNTRMQSNLVGLFDMLDMPSAKRYFFHNAMVIINSSRSKNGFERKLINTTRAIYGKENEKEEIAKKKPFL